ncbi:hypothetical protein DZC30_01990 [Comamonas testosteroni]|uniref:Cell wall surface anchor family protein n=1 Tax=Comamonas testosteroni TaxID=285 RepID=A0A373FQY2_COMTE|nr:hypothetical protein [Comamonas testosteroni]RGE46568.1 hypothetical protein DZC30_01990 [Comamonas testosteroni]
MRKTKVALAVATTISVLAGCGGGGDSSSTSSNGNANGNPSGSSALTVSGVAATGAAMQNAVVTLMDASGQSIKCPTDATSGAFSCDVTKATAPFALSATGNVADSQTTLMSASASSGTQVVNITSLTNAIIASVVGDDPRKLMSSDASLLKSKITSSSVSSAVQAYTTALADVMSATGNAGANLISAPLTAGAPGLDRLLDQIKVNVLPDGSVQLSSVAGASQSTPAVLQLAPGAVPTAADKSSLPSTVVIDGQTVSQLPTPSDLSALQTALNQCFASPSTGSTRLQGSVAACKNIVVDDAASGSLLPNVPSKYLSNGQNAEMDLGSPVIADEGMNGAVFGLPEIIRVQGSDKVWIKLNWTRTDGLRDGMQNIAQVAVKPTSTDKGWRLIGNQRHILSKVLATAQRWDWLNPPKSSTGVSAFINSISLQIGVIDDQNVLTDFAIVTGPGLRNGVLLKPSSGVCEYLNIHAQLAAGDTASSVASKYPGKMNACRTSFKLTGVAQNASEQSQFKWSTTNTAYSNPALSTSEMATLHPLSAYTIQVYQNGNTSTPAYSYTVRVRSMPPQPELLRKYAWQSLSQATKDLLTPTSSTAFTGGLNFPVSWTSAADVPFVKKTSVQIRSTIGAQTSFVTGAAMIKPVAVNTAMSTQVAGAAKASFPAVLGSTGSSDYSFANLSWSDPFDLSFSTNVEYDH